MVKNSSIKMKQYIKPCTRTLNIELCTMITQSMQIKPDTNTEENLSRRHSGFEEGNNLSNSDIWE